MRKYLVTLGFLALPICSPSFGQEPAGVAVAGWVGPVGKVEGALDQNLPEILIQVVFAERNLTSGRINILSRPQIRLLDRQTGLLNSVIVGWNHGTVLLPSKSTIHLQVTPAIIPNAKLTLRAVTEVATPFPHPVPLGNGEMGTGFSVQFFESTLRSVQDGETLVTDGMKVHEKTCHWLDDLPFVGSMLHSLAHGVSRSELIVMLTPRILQTREDADRASRYESDKIDCLIHQLRQPLLGIAGQ